MVNHGHSWAKLGRKTSHRLAMLRNMVSSFFLHERIITTHPKAKAAQRVAERVLTAAKSPNRKIAAHKIAPWVASPTLRDKIITELVPRYASRPGGYTRVAHLKERKGDNAPLSLLELVDRPGEIRPAKQVDAEYMRENQQWQQQNQQFMRKLLDPFFVRPRPGGAY